MQPKDIVLVAARGFWDKREHVRHILPVDIELIFSDCLEIGEEGRHSVRAIVAADQKVDASIMNKFPRLMTIARTGTGYDNIDVVAAKERGIVVTRVAAINAEATSEFTLGLIFTLSMRVIPFHSSMLKKEWARSYWTPLRDLTVGIIGLGHIGRSLVRKLYPLGVKRILGWNRTYRPEIHELELGASRLECVGIPTLVSESDVIVVALALTPETTGFIGENYLAQMKKTALLINVCRGAVIDEDALARYIAEEKIGGVALDVFSIEAPREIELFRQPFMQSLMASARKGSNVILTPHNASITKDTITLISQQVAHNIAGALSGNLERVETIPDL